MPQSIPPWLNKPTDKKNDSARVSKLAALRRKSKMLKGAPEDKK